MFASFAHPSWLRALAARFAPGRALRTLDPRDPLFALAGERFVERALRARGWRFLVRRLRTRWGELDLLFEDQGTLVAIEVKTGRNGPRFQPGMRLDHAALARRWRTVRSLAHGAPSRVDLVEVRLDRRRRAELVHHAGLRTPLGVFPCDLPNCARNDALRGVFRHPPS